MPELKTLLSLLIFFVRVGCHIFSNGRHVLFELLTCAVPADRARTLPLRVQVTDGHSPFHDFGPIARPDRSEATL